MNTHRMRAGLAVAATGLALSASAVLPQAPLSAEALRLLDPSRQMLALCGRRSDRGELLRRRLILAASAAPGMGSETPVALMPGLDAVRYKISTANPEAQRWFDQGLALVYGFNHGEAIRSFKQAQRLDPHCAMCVWGEALSLGTNINAPMDPQQNAAAVAAAKRAMALRKRASASERGLIEALAKRYSPDAKADRAALEADYSNAMIAVAAAHPADDDIAVLAAESVMNTQPWDYWEIDRRTPKGRIGTVIGLVEKVLARHPDHIQAEHLYIHLMEASLNATKAEPYADRLNAPLAPGAGHLVHMPAHIYYVLGRFRDSIASNVAAAKVDEAYLAGGTAAPMYRYGYYPHNVHFIVTSAQMAGDLDTTIEQAAKLSAILKDAPAEVAAWVQPIIAAPYFAYAQAGTPAQVMALAEPQAGLPYVRAMWHYARATALAQMHDEAAARAEIASLSALSSAPEIASLTEAGVPATDLLRLAALVAAARIEQHAGRLERAIALYRDAVKIEDGIPYTEPPFWYYPVRQSLAAAQFAAGDRDGARQSFLEALAQSPNNGWVLYGLAETQKALGDSVGAAASEAALANAWLGDRAWLRMERL